MSNIIRKLDYLFIAFFIISFILLIVVISYTIIDLSLNTYFDFSSRASIENFISAFNWCKSIIGTSFVMFSVFYVFQTFKVHNENKLFNIYLIPKEKNLYDNLNIIKSKNLKIYNFAIRYGKEIMRKIINTEPNNKIENKYVLEIYFNKHIKNHIEDFQCSTLYGTNCHGVCKDCNQIKKYPSTSTSYDQFKTIAFDLFCIDLEYSEFENDLEEIYKKNIPNSNKSSSPSNASQVP